MKSLKDYSLNLSEKEYHELDAWSYSLIARYAKDGFSAISTLHEPVKQTDSMRFGSLFDCMLTRPEDVKKEYEVQDTSVPDAEKKVLDVLATMTSTAYDMVTDEEFQKAISISGYQPRWKYETQKAHLDPFCDYFNSVKSGKTIISQEEWSDALEMYKAVRTNEYLKEHLKNKSDNDKEYIYQAQFIIDYLTENHGTVKMKIMPDMLEVDHKARTIRPWDIKTSAMPGYDFADQFLRFRYDIQAELYTDVLEAVLNKIPEYEDYKILPYLFMDISRADKVPVTYEYDPFEGLSFTKNDKTYQYKGYRELLEEILEYEATAAKVPSYIKTDEPNDLISILSK